MRRLGALYGLSLELPAAAAQVGRAPNADVVIRFEPAARRAVGSAVLAAVQRWVCALAVLRSVHVPLAVEPADSAVMSIHNLSIRREPRLDVGDRNLSTAARAAVLALERGGGGETVMNHQGRSEHVKHGGAVMSALAVTSRGFRPPPRATARRPRTRTRSPRLLHVDLQGIASDKKPGWRMGIETLNPSNFNESQLSLGDPVRS